MPLPPAMAQLIENIRQDGCLTSTVLTCVHGDGLEILSGHHRVEASIAAEIETIDVLVITSPLSAKRKIAIQLSHNAVVGEDDPAVLADLYASLGLTDRKYSGLDDDAMAALADVDLSGLGVGAPRYFDMVIEFLPEEAEQFDRLLKRIERAAKAKRPPVRHVAHYQDFDALFDSLIRVKEHSDIHNSAIAMRMMAELAVERLKQIEAEDAKASEAA
jgi:hypothetical protein